MHRVVEGNSEFHAFPVLRVTVVLVPHGQGDGVAVNVFHHRHNHGYRARPCTQGDGQRHRRQHGGGIEFLGKHLVAHDRPAGGLLQRNIEAFLGVEVGGAGKDDWGRAGDRQETDLKILLFQRPLLLRHGLQRAERNQRGDGCQRRRSADGGEELAALAVVGEQRLHHRGLHHAAVQRVDVAGGGRDVVLGFAMHADRNCNCNCNWRWSCWRRKDRAVPWCSPGDWSEQVNADSMPAIATS